MGVGGSKKEGEEEIERKNFLKVVAIGDPRVGKSCLMAAQTYKTFSRDYVPTVFDNYVSKFVMEDGDVDLGLWGLFFVFVFVVCCCFDCFHNYYHFFFLVLSFCSFFVCFF